MLSRVRSIVRSADTRVRSSTGTNYPPLVSVDGVNSSNTISGAQDPSHCATRSPYRTVPPPTSLELVRQLEACVRELLEISSKDR
jgi:hypothetical protein